MLRELRRFNVQEGSGPAFPVVEVATFRMGSDGREVQDGVGTFLTYGGAEILATVVPGEFRYARSGALVHTVEHLP